MIDKVKGPRIANGANPYLVALLRELQTQVPFAPPRILEEARVQMLRNRGVFPD